MYETASPLRGISPRNFLLRMLIFLVITTFIAFVLGDPIVKIFQANPWLNGLIALVLGMGIFFSFLQVWRLTPEVRWLNDVNNGEPLQNLTMPSLLSAVAFALREGVANTSLSAHSLRSLLDSVAIRLDEGRELLRYMVGLLVFLGLLGTFWGLTLTVASVGDTIQSLNVGGSDISLLFEELKAGLQNPLAGMAVAFSSSLFGLAGSLVLGYLDLQTGQAQNRFYLYVEDWLSAITEMNDQTNAARWKVPDVLQDMGQGLGQLGTVVNDNTNQMHDTIAAIANLSEGVQGLAQHVRTNQDLLRDYMESNGLQQRYILELLEKITEKK